MPNEMSRYKAALALSQMTEKEHAAKLGYKSERIIHYALKGIKSKALRKKLIAWTDKVLAAKANPKTPKGEKELALRRAA